MSAVTNPKYNGITLSPIILAQGGIPMVLPSSGTIGNNGALSALTALPTTYAGAYMYFPVNAIAAGIAAGLYWVVPSSTTAGTIYNNTYTSGVPAAPASPTAFATTGPGAYTQTTGVDITLASVTVPGGLMGINGSIRHELLFIYPNNGNIKTISRKLGAATISTSTRNTSALDFWLGTLRNSGVMNKQVSATNPVPTTASGSTAVEMSIDTSLDSAFTATGQLAVATDYVIVRSFCVEVLPS